MNNTPPKGKKLNTMKRTLTLLLSAAFATTSWAQSVEVTLGEEIVNEGDTIEVAGMPEDQMVAEHFHVKNTTGEAIDVRIIKDEISLPEGMSYTFCFDVCYQPTQTMSNPVTIDPESTYPNSLDTDLIPDDNEGIVLVKMTVKNISAENDSVAFFVRFNVGAIGINNLANNHLIVYPNPAKNYINIDYTGNNNFNNVEIYDAVGKVVKQISTTSVNQTIAVSDLANGVYLVMLKNNDAIISTRKVIIE